MTRKSAGTILRVFLCRRRLCGEMGMLARRRRRSPTLFAKDAKRMGHGALVVATVAMLAAPIALEAQEPVATFHVKVPLVNIFVNVTDRNGAIVGGLTRDDFAVYEDGRPQTISIFDRESAMPLNLVLAIDTSGSVHKDISDEVAAAKRFVHDILRPQDQMSVIQFATTVQVLSSFTNKVAVIDRSLDRLRPDWSSAVYEAICQGSESLGGKDGRKVLVIVSDGDDTAKTSTYPQALEAALRNEVIIYPLIDVPIEASAGRDTGGEHALIQLAEDTGGKHFYVEDGGLDKAFAQVSDDLRTQYVLGYYPKNQEPGKNFHRIVVTIPRAAQDEFNVRNKAGYYADSPVRGN